MRNTAPIQFVLNAVKSRNHKVAAFAVGVAIIVGGAYVWYAGGESVNYEVESNVTVTTTALVLPEANPVRLRIPKINVDAAFEAPLGLKANGEIGVPEAYDTVGYYQYGPTPGEIGPAVILGHVDSYEGPAVLFGLGQLKPGDMIEVEREDNTVAVFEVERLARHEQAGFPTVEVYSDLDYAGLRIITCTGIYDHGSLRYSHNLIVFAKLVSTSTTAVGE